MITALLLSLYLSQDQNNLVLNPDFSLANSTKVGPDHFQLEGKTTWSWVGFSDETAIRGIRFNSFGAQAYGSVSQMVEGLDYTKGHWVKFTVRARADDGFSVSNDKLALKIDFYSKQGTAYIDSAERLIYREVQKDRKDFSVNGNNGKAGAAVWRTYLFEELLPFKEVDSLKLTLSFHGGNGQSKDYSQFCATDFSLIQEQSASDGRKEPEATLKQSSSTSSDQPLIQLGGRWFYQPTTEEHIALSSDGKLLKSLVINADNADRFFYKDDRMVNPFAGNMSAWLRKGYLDLKGELVKEDRFIKDNVTVTFDGSGFINIRARNIPNHQTAKFPDTYGTQGYNPSYIQEHDYQYRWPVDPKPSKKAIAMTDRDANGALNMGTVGIAVNGVAFYNPFDAGMQDASSIMDRCCGHPSPDNRYHYHKYPICVNTPFVDKGTTHSPVIGFALDGMPVYGPYEAADIMARDSKSNPLNAFNAHFDKVRGWHYHVTPGKFPYIIGGYFARWW